MTSRFKVKTVYLVCRFLNTVKRFNKKLKCLFVVVFAQIQKLARSSGNLNYCEIPTLKCKHRLDKQRTFCPAIFARIKVNGAKGSGGKGRHTIQ